MSPTRQAMPRNRSIPDVTVIPVLYYPDLRVAVPWLCAAFGFSERLRIGTHRVQLNVGDGAVVAAQRDGVEVAAGDAHAGHYIMVRVADARAHFAAAAACGARVVQPPQDHPYGERQYSVIDPGGHRWTFTQSIADADPAAWGGELVDRAREVQP